MSVCNILLNFLLAVKYNPYNPLYLNLNSANNCFHKKISPYKAQLGVLSSPVYNTQLTQFQPCVLLDIKQLFVIQVIKREKNVL